MDTALWKPQRPQTSQLWQFMQKIAQEQQIDLPDYQALYDFSLQHPLLFWPAVLDFFQISFSTMN